MEERRIAKAHTLGSFIDEVYAPWAEANIRTSAKTIARLKASFADHLDKKLGDLTPWIIEKWRAARIKEGVKPATVNRDIADLKSSLTKAVGWGLIEANPIASVKRSKVDASRAPRFLSPDEEARLRQALDDREERIRRERDLANAWRADRDYDLLPDLRSAAFADHLKPLVLAVAAHRYAPRRVVRADLAECRFAGRPDHRARRDGEERAHPSSAAEQRGARGAARLAGSIGRQDRAGFPRQERRRLQQRAPVVGGRAKAANITRFRWHDLRHTFASKLVMAGVDLNTVRELLGHSDYAMTQRYAHLAPEHKAAAVAKLVSDMMEERRFAGLEKPRNRL